jgi:hypothetical protein
MIKFIQSKFGGTDKAQAHGTSRPTTHRRTPPTGAATVGVLNINGAGRKSRQLSRYLNNKIKKATRRNAVHFLILTETKQTAMSQKIRVENYEPFASMDARSGESPHPPMGGVTILVHKTYASRTDIIHVPHKNGNAIWLKVHTDEGCHVIAGIYNRPWQTSHQTTEHAQNMSDLERNLAWVTQKHKPVSAIVGGDFNSRMGDVTQDKTTNQYTPRFKEMLNTTGTTLLLAPRAPSPQTHSNWTLLHYDVRSSRTASSIVDYILASAIGAVAENADGSHVQVHQDVHLGSDHRLITCTWHLDLGKSVIDWAEAARNHIDWDTDTITAFSTAVNEHPTLHKAKTRLAELTRKDGQNKPLTAANRDEINKLARALVNMVTQAANEVRTSQQAKRTKDRNASGKELQLEKRRAHLANQIGDLAADDPRIRELFSNLHDTNAELQELHTLRDDKLHTKWWDQVLGALDSDSEQSPDKFWKLIKRLKRTYKTNIFPSAMQNDDSKKWATDMDSIMELIVDHYTSVAAATDKDGTTSQERIPLDIRTQVKDHQTKETKTALSKSQEPCPRNQNVYNDQETQTHMSSDLTREEVADATESRKAGKAAGPMDDTYDMWKHGGAALIDTLHALFQAVWASGSIPSCMNSSSMSLLHKKGNTSLVKNYRPITLMSCLLKIYEKVLEVRLTAHLRKTGVLSHLQNACKPNKGAIDAMEKIKNMQADNPKYMMVSVDLSKAFDRVPRYLLFNKLAATGVDGRLHRAIRATYEEQQVHISIGNSKSKNFQLSAGVKQGSVLSPSLFVIYVNDLLRELDATKYGPILDGTPTPAQMYVDDLVLMATTKAHMLKLFRIVQNFCAFNKCVINTDKTTIIHNNMMTSVRLLMHTLQIPTSALQDSLKYLGVITSAKTGPAGWLPHIEERIKKAKSAYFSLASGGLRSGGASTVPALKMYDSMITPVLMYSGELWETDTASELVLDRCQARILKLMLGLDRKTPTPWVLWETATLPAATKSDLMKVKRWRSTLTEMHQTWKQSHPEPTNHKKRKKLKQHKLHSPSPTPPAIPGSVTRRSKEIARILTKWKVPAHEAAEYLVYEPGTPPVMKTAWYAWATNLAESFHAEQFRLWTESEPQCKTTRAHFLIIKPTRPRIGLLTECSPTDQGRQAVTDTVRLRSHTLEFEADWSKRLSVKEATGVISGEKTLIQCPICRANFLHLQTSTANDTVAHMISTCPGLAEPREVLLTAVAADPTWTNNRHRRFTKEHLHPDRQVALLLRAQSTTHARALSTFMKTSKTIRENAVQTLDSRDLNDKG